MRRVYLAGPVTGCSYEGCTDWRDRVRGELDDYGIEALSPMRVKDYLKGEKNISATCHGTGPFSTSQAVVTRDRFDVMNCDVVLMNLLGAARVSLGSMVELGWADAFRKPVVLVMEPDGNVHEHCFVQILPGFRVATLEEGVAVVRSLLLPDPVGEEAHRRTLQAQRDALRAMRDGDVRKSEQERIQTEELHDLLNKLARAKPEAKK